MITAIELSKKLDSFENLISLLATNSINAKEVWNRENEIRENLKVIIFENEAETAAAKQRFASLFNQLKSTELKLQELREKFTNESLTLISSFENVVANLQSKDSLAINDFNDAKLIIEEIYTIFKVQNWITKESRTAAWEKFNLIKTNFKILEDKAYSAFKEIKAKEIAISNELTNIIKVVINNCHPSISTTTLIESVTTINDYFINNKSQLNIQEIPQWFVINFPEKALYSLKCQSETLSNIRKLLASFKDIITRQDKHDIFELIDSLKDDIQAAWEAHKQSQQQKQQAWQALQEERAAKKEVWLQKQTSFLEHIKQRIEQQQQYLKKQEDFLENQKSFGKKFKTRKLQQQEYIAKLDEQITDLEHKKATAWTEDFRTKVEEWIEEKIQKKQQVADDIIILDNKIKDITSTVEQITLKIQEVKISLSELQTKETEALANISKQ